MKGGRSKLATDLQNLGRLFFDGFGLPRPGGRSKFETDLENMFFMVLGLPGPAVMEAGRSKFDSLSLCLLLSLR